MSNITAITAIEKANAREVKTTASKDGDMDFSAMLMGLLDYIRQGTFQTGNPSSIEGQGLMPSSTWKMPDYKKLNPISTEQLNKLSDAPLQTAIEDAVNATGIDKTVLEAFMLQESGAQHFANGQVKKEAYGGIGIMQITAGNAAGYDLTDLNQNVLRGAQILQGYLQQYGGNVGLAAYAYNSGQGALASAFHAATGKSINSLSTQELKNFDITILPAAIYQDGLRRGYSTNVADTKRDYAVQILDKFNQLGGSAQIPEFQTTEFQSARQRNLNDATLQTAIDAAAKATGIDRTVLEGIMLQESGAQYFGNEVKNEAYDRIGIMQSTAGNASGYDLTDNAIKRGYSSNVGEVERNYVMPILDIFNKLVSVFQSPESKNLSNLQNEIEGTENASGTDKKIPLATLEDGFQSSKRPKSEQYIAQLKLPDLRLPSDSVANIKDIDGSDFTNSFKSILESTFKAASFTHSDGAKNFTVKLLPEHLGEMIIKVSLQDGQVNTHIIVSNNQIADLLSKQLGELRNEFLNQGLSLGQLDVGLQQNFSQEQPSKSFIQVENSQISQEDEDSYTEFKTQNNTGQALDLWA